MRPHTLPLLLPLFVGSGCAALIYEIVWLQMLQLVIGSSAVSLAVLLGTFMGGMCLGSLALPRWLPPHIRPLQAYALLGAQRNCKIVGIFVRLAVRDGKPNYLKFLPRVWGHLAHDLEHPLLGPVKEWMDRYVAPQFRGEIAVRR